MDRDRAWKRLADIADADRSEYERLVQNNRELQLQLSKLRAHYQISCHTIADVTRWLDTENPGTQAQVNRAIDDIVSEHGIPAKWRVNLFYQVMTGRQVIGVAFGGGLPGMRGGSDEKTQIVINPDVDVTNPIVQEDIKHWQLKLDPIPRPQPMKGNPKELDWRPLWEWHKRHPQFTLAEIAGKLHYNPVTVRRKLAELATKLP